MGLRDISIPEELVKVSGGEVFAVRGLCLDDISYLMRRHGPHIKKLFEDFTQKGEVTVEGVAAFAMPILQSAPEIAAELIACAAGERDATSITARLPVPVQLDALEKLALLTFDAEGGPKKLLETVLRMAQGVSGLVAQINAPVTSD